MSGSVTIAGSPVTETVPGPGGSIVTLLFPASSAPTASVLLGQIAAGIGTGTMVPEAATPPTSVPSVPSGNTGALFVGTAQAVTVPSSYSAVVDNAAGASTITILASNLTDLSNISVVASGGPLTFYAGFDSVEGGIAFGTNGTLVGGDAGVFFVDPLLGGTRNETDSGAWLVALGGGNNTIQANGNDTISAGPGQNLIYLGADQSSVASTGTDTIVAGTGAETISTASNNALIFGRQSELTFSAGTSTSTVAGAGETTVLGGSGATLFFGGGQALYQGYGAADTIVGGGRLVGDGNGGNVLLVGGASGGNTLTSGAGSATLLGGGNGDLLTAVGSSSVILAAGAGSETLNGTAATGANFFFGGGGSNLMQGGSGNDALVAGTGNDTLSGGGGVNLFVFNNTSGAAKDVITDFDPTRDFVLSNGFGTGAIGITVQTQMNGANGTQITLPNGTQVLFAGLSSLSTYSFS